MHANNPSIFAFLLCRLDAPAVELFNSRLIPSQFKHVNRADGCSYHELKVMKNILVEVSRAVRQNKNLYS